MQTENRPEVNVFQLRVAISDATQRLEKVEALLNCLSNEYLGWSGNFDMKTIVDFVAKGTPQENSETGNKACDWANGYAHVRKMFEIIDDYVRMAKADLKSVSDGGNVNV